MTTQKKSISNIWRFCIMSLLFGGCFFLFSQVNTQSLYQEYAKLWDYRRLHPDFQNNEKTIRIFDAGHTTTYADFLWMGLIQYIADNIGNGKYIDFYLPLVDTITKLHPKFTYGYQLALLLTPSLDLNNPSYEANKRMGEKSLLIGERGIQENCNSEKVTAIKNSGIEGRPWEKGDLKNPCTDGNIAYYAAYVADGIGNREKSAEYYTLASAHTDAPEASRFLAVLAKGRGGDRIDAALKFFLLGAEGYDEDPFICKNASIQLIGLLQKGMNIDMTLLSTVKNIEQSIQPPKDTKNPLAQSTTNCYESMNRGIKQLYLGYITQKLEPYPNIMNGDEILSTGILTSFPIPESYSGTYTVRRQKDGRWEYQQIF